MSRQDGILSETLDKFLFEETLTGEQRSTIRNQIGVAASLGSVADAAERKNPASYPNGIDVGQTRVVQANLPGIIWTLVDADVTQDSSWIGQPYTVDPNGEIIVSMELADIAGTIPAAGEIGRIGLNRVVLGDGFTPNGLKVGEYATMLPAACFQLDVDYYIYLYAARFISTASAAITATVRTTTGYACLVNFDGTLSAVFGTGNPSADISVTGKTPVAPYNSAIPKFYALFVCDSTGYSFGTMGITRIIMMSNEITFFDGSDLSRLTYLNLSYNHLSLFDGDGMSSLQELLLVSNRLKSFDGSKLFSLSILNLTFNYLQQLDLYGLTALTRISAGYNRIKRVDFSTLGSLTTLRLSNNALVSFEGRGLGNLQKLELGFNSISYFDGNGLTSKLEDAYFYFSFSNLTKFYVGTTGWVPATSAYFGTPALPLSFQQLNVQALQTIYNELPNVVGSTKGHVIIVTSNPGAGAGSGTDPSVATAKGWTVTGDSI